MQHLSKEFRIETVDHKKKLSTDVGRTCPFATLEDHGLQEPPLHAYHFPSRLRPFRYGYLDSDMKALLMKAYDACAVTDSTVAIHINKVNSGIKKFPNYAELFIGKKDEMVTTRKVHQEFPDPVKGYHWEIIATSWDAPEQVSFVNGVSTILGGTRRLRPQPDHQEGERATTRTRTLTSSLNTSRTNCS
jgi:hypothetical protein